MKLPNLPADHTVVTPADGRLTEPWWLHFDAVVRWLKSNGGTIYTTLAQRTIVTTRGYRSPGSVADGAVDVETDTGSLYQMRAGTWVQIARSTIYGTLANRPAATAVPDGTLYVITDWNEVVYQAQAGVWKYISGTYTVLQSAVVALIATLTANDVGLRIRVSDYEHVLWCTAAATTGWAPEDDKRAGEITHFDVAPTGTGWKLIDGNGDDGSAIGAGHPIKILKSDGTTRNNTTAAAQNANVFLRGAAAYNGAVTGKTAPTVGGSTASGTAVIGNDTDAGTVIASAGAVSVALRPHTHVDSGHTHAATGLTTSLAGGPPVDYSDALPYIRK